MRTSMSCLLRTTAALSLLSAVAVGCGGGSGSGPPLPKEPKIIEFRTSTASVSIGQRVELTWTVSDATKVTIDATPGGRLLDTTDLSGTVRSSTIGSATTFTLTASGHGLPAVRALAVEIGNTGTVAIQMFTAVPSAISRGSSSTLTWQTTNASSVEITTQAGDAVVPDGTRFSDTQTVTPTVTTIYILRAKGYGGPAVREATLVVAGMSPPSIRSFVATPSSINEGQHATLTWHVTEALLIAVADSAGNSLYQGAAPDGALDVAPQANETYTLTATNTAGRVQAHASVEVISPNGAQILAFDASPTSIKWGSSSSLHWSVAGASGGVQITRGRVVVLSSTAASGMFTVTPTQTADYLLSAFSPMGNASRSLRVTVVPWIESFRASPNPVARGQHTTLSWSVHGADRIGLLEGGATILDSTTATGTGSLSVAITAASTVFELDASNTSSTAAARLTVIGQ
jgi:hypothetical protein